MSPQPESQASPNDRETLRALLESAEYCAYHLMRPSSLFASERVLFKRRLVMRIRAAEALANASGHLSAKTWRALRDLRRAMTGEAE